MSHFPQPLAGLDLAPFRALNNRHPVEVGPPLSEAVFEKMVAMAFYARAVGDGQGFLLAFDQDAPYVNANFEWFKACHNRFVYIDRVLVDPSGQGQGMAKALYLDLFAVASAAHHGVVCAEINSDPPNLASDAFHNKLGFETVGSTYLPNQGKTVRYVAKNLIV